MQIRSERFWRAVDLVATTCPLCAFGRGALAGIALAELLRWLM